MTSLTNYSNETQKQAQHPHSVNNNNNNSNGQIGDVLFKVQDQLRNLRFKLNKEGNKFDLKSLQNILEKVENDIQTQSDQYINHLNNQVQILQSTFSYENTHENDTNDDLYNNATNSLALDNILDLTSTTTTTNRIPLNNNNNNAKRKASINVSDISSLQSKGIAIVRPNNYLEIKRDQSQQQQQQLAQQVNIQSIDFVQKNIESSLNNNNNNNNQMVQQFEIETIQQLTGPSPGQQLKMNRTQRALLNPFNVKNREHLQEQFNIQLPLIEQRKELKLSTHLITGTTIQHLATLPLEYKRNPTLVPPPISEHDAKYGLISLLQRGLIPTNAQITFDPQPIATKTIDIKEPKANASIKKYLQMQSTHETGVATVLQSSQYKLDPSSSISKLSNQTDTTSINANNNNNNNNTGVSLLNRLKEKPNRLNKGSVSIADSITTHTQVTTTSNVASAAGAPPVTPTQLMDQLKVRNHRLIIQNGLFKLDKPEFIYFKQFYCLHWGNIVSVLRMLEDLCQVYLISVAFVNGDKVAELSNTLQMEHKPTLDELLKTFINRDDIEKLIHTPGRRFLNINGGKQLAAVAIQTAWRRYRDRHAYLRYRRRKWAAGVIALAWLTHVKMSKAREELKRKRVRQLEFFRRKTRELIKAWPKLKHSKRTIIHIPSLGYSLNIRESMRDLSKRENYQIARLCDILDDNVDVIYVSALQITEETLQYYAKLFSLRSGTSTFTSVGVCDLSQRYKIVVPEALNSFPTHKMALSTLLKYSPKALNRIRNLIKGRDAYIVPGVMNHDDLHVAEMLNVPILASEPEVAYLYSTKSGSKRIFQSACVCLPYGEFDIYNRQQLHECLAQEITEHLDVQRWLFKLDDEVDGRGIAYLDVARHLSCYQLALKEKARYGVKWSKKWAQEATYVKILSEIPECLDKYAQVVNLKVYSTWDVFEKAFLAQGGILEACPPSDNVTALSVSMLIEPDASVQILTSGDHVHAESHYSCWGYSFPQSSVDSKLLNETCLKIASACKQRNIRGYLDIDFVTYIDAQTNEQILWATDLNISYSESVSMTSLLVYMTNGSFNSDSHTFQVEEPKDYVKQKNTNRYTNDEFNPNRYAVMSSRLYHSNLAVIHYSVFFQTCRAHGIGFDVKEKQGTLFLLIDSLNHSNLGMISIGEDLQATLQQFSHNLNALHHEISSDNMQGNTNFLMAMHDISNILGLTNENNQHDEKDTQK